MIAILLLWTQLGAAETDERLHKLREQRRIAQHSAQLTKADANQPLLFGLLVIPVDFSDARQPTAWQSATLGQKLTPTAGETLANYFRVASQERLEMRVTLAPLVRLTGARADYSDIGFSGFTRSRALATEAISAVVATGLDLRLLDMDGPDRTPGTSDDDGQVDGVLILHAGIGQENDLTEGLVQALQYYLDEPVQSDGVEATFYATASLSSGLGIWAHETGHLLGMEDRYDPLLPTDGNSEVLNRGGLGRFSLMASGAWGTGGGAQPALPDAYTASQLGWYDVRDLPAYAVTLDTLRAAAVGGDIWRIWTNGQTGHEFFLLETRAPADTAPFDAAVPGAQLLIYHIDETVPAGGYTVDGPQQWHLRARLVEADDDSSLHRGLDDGDPADLFPGTGDVTRFGPATTPDSQGYTGPSQVDISSIAALADGVVLRATAAETPALTFAVEFTSSSEPQLELTARSRGTPLSDLTCTISALGPQAWGTFAGGSVVATRELIETEPGTWVLPAPLEWFPALEVPAGARTTFRYDFSNAGWQRIFERPWVWQGTPDVLDFTDTWPGEWVVDNIGSSGTTWHRWAAAPWLTVDGTPVLACTGADFQDAGQWPNVNYTNGAHTTLTSGHLGPEVVAVRLLHALAVEILSPGVAMDGALVVWVAVDGSEIPASPVDGWPGSISAGAENPRKGTPCFTSGALELDGDLLRWRTDVFEVPTGPGPWRLRLILAANGLWRREGWFVADVAGLTSGPAAAALPFSVDPFAGAAPLTLAWSWPWSAAVPPTFTLQRRETGSNLPAAPIWLDVWSGELDPEPGTANFVLPWLSLENLPGGSGRRHEIRLMGGQIKGSVVSRTLVVYPDGGDGVTTVMSDPWPNPSRSEVHFLLNLSGSGSARLVIYDLRGRMVREMLYPVGQHLALWHGDDQDGRPVAAGTYFLRLSQGGTETLRKVVLLH